MEPAGIAVGYWELDAEGELADHDASPQEVNIAFWRGAGDADLADPASEPRVLQDLADSVVQFETPPFGSRHRFYAEYLGRWKILVRACNKRRVGGFGGGRWDGRGRRGRGALVATPPIQ